MVYRKRELYKLYINFAVSHHLMCVGIVRCIFSTIVCIGHWLLVFVKVALLITGLKLSGAAYRLSLYTFFYADYPARPDSSKTSALYKSCTYLLTYLLTYCTIRVSSSGRELQPHTVTGVTLVLKVGCTNGWLQNAIMRKCSPIKCERKCESNSYILFRSESLGSRRIK